MKYNFMLIKLECFQCENPKCWPQRGNSSIGDGIDTGETHLEKRGTTPRQWRCAQLLAQPRGPWECVYETRSCFYAWVREDMRTLFPTAVKIRKKVTLCKWMNKWWYVHSMNDYTVGKTNTWGYRCQPVWISQTQYWTKMRSCINVRMIPLNWV